MAEEKQQAYLLGVNMTKLFTRDAMMHSIGDIRLKSPISLKKAGYTVVFFALWTAPLIYFVGIHFNLPFTLIAIGPPMILAWLATSNLFGGKNLIDYTSTLIKFILAPRGWTDSNPKSPHYAPAKGKFDEHSYFIAKEVWISRRRELKMLAPQEPNKKKPAKKSKQNGKKASASKRRK